MAAYGMPILPWTETIDSAGAWLCHHATWEGDPAPSTRLLVASASPESAERPASNKRASVHCEDCGTCWRVWEDLGIAKYYVSHPSKWTLRTPSTNGPQYRRAYLRDIDKIVYALLKEYAALEVAQHQYIWPADDEGLWWIRLSQMADEPVQLESGTGMCPFIVETNARCSLNALRVETIEDAVLLIMDHFSAYQR